MEFSRHVIFFLILLALGSCNAIKSNKIQVSSNHIIDSEIIKHYLNDSLWRDRDAYDAAHNLMIPLHYAILYNDKVLIESFENHFSNMLLAYDRGEVKLRSLHELQYLTLASRYLALDSDLLSKKLKSKLVPFLKRRFSFFWEEIPSSQWAYKEINKRGLKNRIVWKLDIEEKKKSYFNIIVDSEMYVLGIGADLLTYYKRNNMETNEIIDVIPIYKRILDERLIKREKGWVFQEDFWLDHPDYAYSAYLQEPDKDSEPKRAISIQEDSSHSHRWALWLLQFRNYLDLKEIQARLEWQLVNVVISKDQKLGVPVLNNFMCGHNGYFRWGYNTHNSTGYAPYKLSGTFGFGWWSLLGGNGITEQYFQLYTAYPLNQNQKTLYSQISTRERNPIVENSHDNNLRKNLALMAYKLAIKL